MRKARNLRNRLMAVLLSAAMAFAPVLQSLPVYAAEITTGTEDVGTMPETAEPDASASVSGSDASVAVSGNEAADAVSGNDATGTVSDNDAATGGVSGNDAADIFGIEPFGNDAAGLLAVTADSFASVGGWNESIYAEINGVADADVTEVSYSGAMTGSLTGDDLKYLVRDNKSGGVRIDIPGLKAGTYELTVKVGDSTLTKSGITVYAYDRSGYAHFNYTDGVGAYKDDGTLKDNAVVLYVTDDNKNDVTLSSGSITVKGIGNILNSVGQVADNGLTSNGGTPNTNQGIIKAIAQEGKPLVVRFIGTVSESDLRSQGTFDAASKGLIEGLTVYNSLNNGGSVDDNGHMARIQSGKDITLEGIGYDAVIDGWGFHYIAQTSDPNLGKSFEVRNLTFINTPEDAIGMEGQQASKNTSSDLTASVERCWIHNNEFYRPHIASPAESDKADGDGSVDFKRGQYFTCSYNYFEGCHKTNLVGSADYTLQYNLSYHHNHWYMCKARGPLARNANIHMYNNIVDMQTDYAQNTRANAYIFSEYNLFYACKSPQAVEEGAIKSYHDSIASVIWNMGEPGTVVTNKSEYVSNACQFKARKIKYDKFDVDPALSYIPDNNYKLETDFTELRKVIKAQTGVQDQKPKTVEEVTRAEYSVLPENAKVNTFSSLPQNLTPGKISKTVYAFTVNGAFNLEVAYADAAKPGVLVNEAGENLLQGDGSRINLPAGTYMIQPVNFQPGDASKGTTAVFKDITINTLNITAFDPSAHYHNWMLDASQSKAATCTEEGENVYTCSGSDCDVKVKKETVAALGHDWKWTVITPATETTPGLEREICSRCKTEGNEREIPAGSSGGGTGDEGGGGTAEGEYVLTFDVSTGKVDSANFFTVSGNCSNSKGTVEVNGTTYTDCLKMESATSISFSCNAGSTLFMVFGSGGAGKRVKIDGETHTINADGTLTVELAKEGTHTITKGDSCNLFYLSVKNGAPKTYTLTFNYNYEGAPAALTVTANENASYASMAEMVPAEFVRNGYTLTGLYRDAACTDAVTYPYAVTGNATFFAAWQEDSNPDNPDNPDAPSYFLHFNANGGLEVPSVKLSGSKVYEITQKTTRAGYAFIGWYDALEGGRLITRIDCSALTGDYTVYAHWNVTDDDTHSLDCSNLPEGDITEQTTAGGFTIHGAPGGGGANGDDPKYSMTVRDGGLYTNGVLLTDKSIPGNEDGLLKSIEFTARGSGILTVEMALAEAPAEGGTYHLVLATKAADGSLEKVDSQAITTGTAKTTKVFAVDAAGTYYLYAEGDQGVVYYSLKFTEQIFTVIFRAGSGKAPADLKNVTAKAGEVIQIPDCIPAAGYTFKGWSLDGGVTVFKGSYTVKASDATEGVIIITAFYEAIGYTVKFDAGEGALPEGLQDISNAVVGTRLTPGACTPPEGKKFLGWSIGDSGEICTTYEVNAADADENKIITLKAVYAAESDETVYYKVILDTDGGMLADGGSTERLVEANGTIDPGKCEKEGYTFKEWTVDGAAVTMPYTVTKDVTLKAVYTLNNSNIGGDEPPVVVKHEGIAIIGLEKEYAFTGARITPEIGVVDYDVDDGRILAPGVDYTVKYTNNTKVGTATVTVKGKKNYAGKDATKTFKIVAVKTVTEGLADLKGAKIGKIGAVTYNGEAQYPKFTLKLKGGAPTEYIYDAADGRYETAEGTAIPANVALSNNVRKGTATLLLTGAADSKNRETKVKKTFKINAADFDDLYFEITVEDGIYSAKGAEPWSVTVEYKPYEEDETGEPIFKDENVKLINGTDYTIKCSANKRATDAAQLTIIGKGNYTGRIKSFPYGIQKLDMRRADVNVKAVTAYAGITAGKVKATVVDCYGNALKPAQYNLKVYKKDGVTEYDAKDKLEAGAVIYVKAVAKDTANLANETSAERFVVGANIAKAKVALAKVNGKAVTKMYTGAEVELEAKDLIVTIKGKSEPLEMGKDFEIAAYSNNINAGTATAVIKGINGYSGTKTVKFKIVGKTMKTNEEVATWDDVSGMIKSLMQGLFR